MATYLQDEEEDLFDPEAYDGIRPTPKPLPKLAEPPVSVDAVPTITPEMRRVIGNATPSKGLGEMPVDEKVRLANDDLARLKGQAPSAPKPKWWQKAAAAAIGFGAGYSNAEGKARQIDAGPAADALMGLPQYQRNLSDWNKQVAGAQAKADAANANRDTWRQDRTMTRMEDAEDALADKNRASAEQIAGKNDEALTAKKIADAEAQDKLWLKGREDDAFVLQPGEQPPDGWTTYTSAANPKNVWAVPPRFMALPQELAKYAPGRKVGEKIPLSEYKTAMKTAQSNILAQEKPPTAAVKDINAVKLAIMAAGGNPDDPTTITPAIAKKATEIMKPPAQSAGGVQLTPEALDYWARFAGTTGQMPALGMGNGNNPTRAQILNRAPLVAGGDVAANRATNRADSGSLASIQKMRDSVTAFENTANANLDIFLKAAKPLIDADSPLLNKPLRSIDRNALGSADVAAYDAARRVAINEVAKVTNNPTLAGQLSDSARHEVEGLVPEQATLAQIYRVVGVLKQDMANRRRFLDQQIQEIHGRLSGGNAPANPNPNGYLKDHVYGGMTYLGGDPNSPASWRK